jgi:hypothetical protein
MKRKIYLLAVPLFIGGAEESNFYYGYVTSPVVESYNASHNAVTDNLIISKTSIIHSYKSVKAAHKQIEWFSGEKNVDPATIRLYVTEKLAHDTYTDNTQSMKCLKDDYDKALKYITAKIGYCALKIIGTGACWVAFKMISRCNGVDHTIDWLFLGMLSVKWYKWTKKVVSWAVRLEKFRDSIINLAELLKLECNL